MIVELKVKVDCDGDFCGKCESFYIDDDGCEVCGIFNMYLVLEMDGKRPRRRIECIGAEIKENERLRSELEDALMVVGGEYVKDYPDKYAEIRKMPAEDRKEIFDFAMQRSKVMLEGK